MAEFNSSPFLLEIDPQHTLCIIFQYQELIVVLAAWNTGDDPFGSSKLEYPGCWHERSNCERKKSEISSLMDDLFEAWNCRSRKVPSKTVHIFILQELFSLKKTVKKLVWQFAVEQNWKGLVWIRIPTMFRLFILCSTCTYTTMKGVFSGASFQRLAFN